MKKAFSPFSIILLFYYSILPAADPCAHLMERTQLQGLYFATLETARRMPCRMGEMNAVLFGPGHSFVKILLGPDSENAIDILSIKELAAVELPPGPTIPSYLNDMVIYQNPRLPKAFIPLKSRYLRYYYYKAALLKAALIAHKADNRVRILQTHFGPYSSIHSVSSTSLKREKSHPFYTLTISGRIQFIYRNGKLYYLYSDGRKKTIKIREIPVEQGIKVSNWEIAKDIFDINEDGFIVIDQYGIVASSKQTRNARYFFDLIELGINVTPSMTIAKPRKRKVPKDRIEFRTYGQRHINSLGPDKVSFGEPFAGEYDNILYFFDDIVVIESPSYDKATFIMTIDAYEHTCFLNRAAMREYFNKRGRASGIIAIVDHDIAAQGWKVPDFDHIIRENRIIK